MLPRKKSRVEWGLSFVAMALAAAAAPVRDPAHVARTEAGSKASGPAACRPRVSGGGAVPRIPG